MSRKKKRTPAVFSFWQSYSDMMAALILVFVMILAGTLLDARKTFEKKQAELEDRQQIILREQSALREKEETISAQRAELEEKEAILLQIQGELAEKEAIAERTRNELDAKEITIAQKQVLVEEQKEVIEKQQAQIDAIIGVRSGLIRELNEEFSHSDLKVRVDPQTGAIAFDSTLLFESGQYYLRPAGREFLDEFLPLYFGVLLRGEFSKYVAEIIIEGHTDPSGKYMYNLRLSQDRAFAVASYFLADGRKLFDRDELEILRKLVTANGKASSVPVLNPDGTTDMEASRRVEIKFRLHDEKMIDELAKIMGE